MTVAPTLAPGTRLGIYTITAPIGAGAIRQVASAAAPLTVIMNWTAALQK